MPSGRSARPIWFLPPNHGLTAARKFFPPHLANQTAQIRIEGSRIHNALSASIGPHPALSGRARGNKSPSVHCLPHTHCCHMRNLLIEC
jgi:hypothetical protein